MTLVKNLDMLALTKAIVQAETGYFKHGSGVTHNNGCGYMTWKSGTREFKRFESKQAGFDACYSLIKRKYQEYTIDGMANKWTGSDRADTWAYNVKHWYKKFI